MIQTDCLRIPVHEYHARSVRRIFKPYVSYNGKSKIITSQRLYTSSWDNGCFELEIFSSPILGMQEVTVDTVAIHVKNLKISYFYVCINYQISHWPKVAYRIVMFIRIVNIIISK